MRTPAFGRARRRVRSLFAAARDWTLGAARTALQPLGVSQPTESDGWERAWATRGEVRWHRDGEQVEVFRFDDGFVATVEYPDSESRWQLTTGPMRPAQALLAVALYCQFGVTPQIDREGRPFVAETDDGPTQVFRDEPAEPVRYVYLDEVRTVEEFPDYVADRDAFRGVHDRLTPDRQGTLHSD